MLTQHNSEIKIKGETLSELPQDLYIPPDALEVYLEAFEGPLDLLVYLIRKHNLDILDIPMLITTFCAKIKAEFFGEFGVVAKL